jgi:hypothetical protein
MSELTLMRFNRFFLKWAVVNILGGLIALLLYIPISMLFSPNEPLHKGIAGSVVGCGFGLGQWFLIRRYLNNSGWWILVTFLGFALGGAAMGVGTTEELARRGLTTETVGFALGGSAGVFQWLVLRRHVNLASLWIPASIAAFGFGWWLQWSIDFGFEYNDPMGLLFGILILVIPFIGISGFVLGWLLKENSKPKNY